MSEERRISDLVDKAIIEVLKEAEGGILQRKAIAKLVKERINENDGLISKRIEKRCKDSKRYLVSCGRGLYKLDPEILFIFVGESLPPKNGLTKSANNPPCTDFSLERRKAHTHDLKQAIKNWIDHFPQPTYKYSSNQDAFDLSEIFACEGHPLFSDLRYHFSQLGSPVLANWDDYKGMLLNLDELKSKIFAYAKEVVLHCFEGLDLHFVDRLEDGFDFDNEGNCICISVPDDLYNYCISYHLFYRSIGNPNPDIEIFYPFSDYETFQCKESDDSIIWGGAIGTQKENRDALLRGRNNLLEVLGKPPDNRFMFDVNVIISMVGNARQSKEIISELNRIELYSALPGNCDYIG
jgi:hypothetical protein